VNCTHVPDGVQFSLETAVAWSNCTIADPPVITYLQRCYLTGSQAGVHYKVQIFQMLPGYIELFLLFIQLQWVRKVAVHLGYGT
jgi:hypothetical protein